MPQRSKQSLETLQTQIRFEGLRQGFPTGARLIQLFGLLLTQVNQGLKRRCEKAEIRSRSSLLPAVVAVGLGLGQGGDEGWIEGLLPLQVLFQQIQIAALLWARSAELQC